MYEDLQLSYKAKVAIDQLSPQEREGLLLALKDIPWNREDILRHANVFILPQAPHIAEMRHGGLRVFLDLRPTSLVVLDVVRAGRVAAIRSQGRQS